MTLEGVIQGVISGVIVRFVWEIMTNADFRKRIFHRSTVGVIGTMVAEAFGYMISGIYVSAIFLVPLIIVELVISIFIKNFTFLPRGLVGILMDMGLSANIATFLIVFLLIVIGKWVGPK